MPRSMHKPIFFQLSLSILALALLSGCQSGEVYSGKTASGLPYRMHVDKEGTSPETGDKVRFYFSVYQNGNLLVSEDITGVLPDLTSDSRIRPEVELLYLMQPGDSASVYLFGEALGLQQAFEVQPDDTIRYSLRMVDIVLKRADREYIEEKTEMSNAIIREVVDGYRQQTLGDRLKTLDSGVRYVLLNEGNGKLAVQGQKMTVHYVGTLMDGTIFDSSFQRGAPFTYNLGTTGVITGWQEGLKVIPDKGAAVLIIPQNLAYGAEGVPPAIPPYSDIVFYIEVLEVVDGELIFSF